MEVQLDDGSTIQLNGVVARQLERDGRRLRRDARGYVVFTHGRDTIMLSRYVAEFFGISLGRHRVTCANNDYRVESLRGFDQPSRPRNPTIEVVRPSAFGGFIAGMRWRRNAVDGRGSTVRAAIEDGWTRCGVQGGERALCRVIDFQRYCQREQPEHWIHLAGLGGGNCQN